MFGLALGPICAVMQQQLSCILPSGAEIGFRNDVKLSTHDSTGYIMRLEHHLGSKHDVSLYKSMILDYYLCSDLTALATLHSEELLSGIAATRLNQ